MHLPVVLGVVLSSLFLLYFYFIIVLDAGENLKTVGATSPHQKKYTYAHRHKIVHVISEGNYKVGNLIQTLSFSQRGMASPNLYSPALLSLQVLKSCCAC